MSNRVDVVIPNMVIYLKTKRTALRVFSYYGHADAIGALPLLAGSEVPVLGPVDELAKLFVKSNDSVKKFNDFHVIDQNSQRFTGVPSSLSFKQPLHPESISCDWHSGGNIVYTGDFRVTNCQQVVRDSFARPGWGGREGVLALLIQPMRIARSSCQ